MRIFYFEQLITKNKDQEILTPNLKPIPLNLNSNSFSIIKLKHELSKFLKMNIDRITIMSTIDQTQLNDTQNFPNTPENSKFYYSIKPNTKTKLIIEYYQQNIDKLILEVNETCSYFCLKHIISLKIGVPMEELSLMDKVNGVFLNDDDVIYEKDFVSCNSKSNNSLITNCESYNKIENILLMRKGKTNFKIGLDLSFTLMKDLKRISFDKDAPDYREVSDGLSLFCYCRNRACELFDEMFVKNLGKINLIM